MAVRNLPEREKRSDEQQTGHRQHGGRLLHAVSGHGPQSAGLCLGTPAVLEATTLGSQVPQTGLPVGHQQGENHLIRRHFVDGLLVLGRRLRLCLCL